MDLRTVSIHRIVPWLGATIVVASFASLRDLHRGRGIIEIIDNVDLVHHLILLLLGALGVHAAWRAKRTFDPVAAQRLAFAGIGGVLMLAAIKYSLLDSFRYPDREAQFQFAADVLVTGSAALLWGCSLARLRHSEERRSRSIARKLTAFLALTLALQVYLTVVSSGYLTWWLTHHSNARPKLLVTTYFRCLPTLWLFRACIQVFWPIKTPDLAPRQAKVVFVSMVGWFLSEAGWWIYKVLSSVFQSQSFGNAFWSGLLLYGLILLIAASTFLWLVSPEPEPLAAPDSIPPAANPL